MKNPAKAKLLLLLFGGILPVIAFAIVEDKYGVIWGTIAGMFFGVGEIIYEKLKLKKVSGVTWFANALILILGGLTLVSSKGVWFKLQPAIFFISFAVILLGSSMLKKPLLVEMARKQNPEMPPAAIELMGTFNWRLGFVFIFIAALSGWAALYWSTEAWAFLKSIGVFIILLLYLGAEIIYRKYFKSGSAPRH